MEASAPVDGSRDVCALHQALVDTLKRIQPPYADDGLIHSPSVEAAFRAVPRHLFLPGVALDKAYSDEAIPTKHQDGVPISSSSQPAIMAIMLEQLGLRPGHRVLEIGAGTGYNAALMAHIVGDTGHVVTVDIDQDIVDKAREHLAAAGCDRVQVVCGDGWFGYAGAAPYDRIILTVGAWDIASSWREQLRPGGRLVLPLSIRGLQQSIGFEQVDGYLRSLSMSSCGFMVLRGAFAAPPNRVQLGAEPGLFLEADNAGLIDTGAVFRWLAEPGRDRPTTVQVTHPEMYEGMLQWLALREPAYCTLSAEGEMSLRGIVPWLYGRPGKFCGTSGLIGKADLAVLTLPPDLIPPLEPVETLPPPPEEPPALPPAFEPLIRAFGPDDTMTSRLIEQIVAWDRAGRPTFFKDLRIRAYPLDTEYVPSPGEIVVPKRWTRFVFDWP
jgi:protein-L-isoaspartate(D-aspartate) O-methyltransferase